MSALSVRSLRAADGRGGRADTSLASLSYLQIAGKHDRTRVADASELSRGEERRRSVPLINAKIRDAPPARRASQGGNKEGRHSSEFGGTK